MKKILSKVKNVTLEIEDHGILQLIIYLEYGTGNQSFGGYRLCRHDKEKNRSVGTASGLDYILRILNLFKVNRLEEIKGKTVYALKSLNSVPFTSNDMVIGLEMPKFDGGDRFLISEWQSEK